MQLWGKLPAAVSRAPHPHLHHLPQDLASEAPRKQFKRQRPRSTRNTPAFPLGGLVGE